MQNRFTATNRRARPRWLHSPRAGGGNNAMALTRTQRRIVGEIEELLRIGGYDWRLIEELYEPAARLGQLQRIKLDFIRMKVIGDYVFADELLTVVIVSYFFPVRNQSAGKTRKCRLSCTSLWKNYLCSGNSLWLRKFAASTTEWRQCSKVSTPCVTRWHTASRRR